MTSPRLLWLDLLASVGAAIFLVLAGGHHHYSFYNLLRIVVFAVALYMTWRSYRAHRTALLVMFGIIAALFNPFAPIYLSRQVWRPIDLICAIAIVVGALVLRGVFDRWLKR
jgi:Na+/H+ antiporter NhaD/arsenite permease-like protein